jgi:hypothetical protein
MLAPSVLPSIASYAAVILVDNNDNDAADEENDEVARYLAQKHNLTHLNLIEVNAVRRMS